ncbi:MAG: hypothetical protein IPF99_33140 [Deltaproteobacteria bacterium]|nr:hypothetical protein [Deltaproteobacteria bacterium]
MTSLRVDGFGADRPRPLASLLAQPAEPPPRLRPRPRRRPLEARAEACDVDCETAHEDALMARVRHARRRTQLLRTHRAFAIAAWSGMLITEVLGTIQAVNQPTWFGDGACTSDPEAFGCHQSSMITGLHEGFAITTTALYTTAAILAVARCLTPVRLRGRRALERTLRLHKTMAWVHGVGMVLLPCSASSPRTRRSSASARRRKGTSAARCARCTP